VERHHGGCVDSIADQAIHRGTEPGGGAPSWKRSAAGVYESARLSAKVSAPRRPWKTTCYDGSCRASLSHRAPPTRALDSAAALIKIGSRRPGLSSSCGAARPYGRVSLVGLRAGWKQQTIFSRLTHGPRGGDRWRRYPSIDKAFDATWLGGCCRPFARCTHAFEASESYRQNGRQIWKFIRRSSLTATRLRRHNRTAAPWALKRSAGCTPAVWGWRPTPRGLCCVWRRSCLSRENPARFSNWRRGNLRTVTRNA